MEREQGLSPEEMEAQDAAALPDREAMSLLDVNANLDLALDLAAPVDAAVAANANVAAPIDAAVSANVLSPDATSVASAPQDSVIAQDLDGEANATATQDSTIGQGEQAEPEPAPAPEPGGSGTGGETAQLGDTVGQVGDTAGGLGDTAGGLLGGGQEAVQPAGTTTPPAQG